MRLPKLPANRDGIAWLVATYVGVLVIFALAGNRTPAALRVAVAGRVQSVAWGPGCSCWIANLVTPTNDRVDLRVNRPHIVRADHDVLAIGRIDPEYPTLVNVDWLRGVDLLDLRPLSLVTSLHENRELAVVILVLLAAFGWQAVTLAQSVAASATSMITAVVVLDLAAMKANIGFPDVSWVLTLITGACFGWQLAGRANALLQGKLGSVSASAVTALLFGDLGGPAATLVGVAVPMLAYRLTLPFMIAVCLSAAIQLPPIADRAIAAGVLLAACVDRYVDSRSRRGETGTVDPL